jgi:hypothetical protein
MFNSLTGSSIVSFNDFKWKKSYGEQSKVGPTTVGYGDYSNQLQMGLIDSERNFYHT